MVCSRKRRRVEVLIKVYFSYIDAHVVGFIVNSSKESAQLVAFRCVTFLQKSINTLRSTDIYHPDVMVREI